MHVHLLDLFQHLYIGVFDFIKGFKKFRVISSHLIEFLSEFFLFDISILNKVFDLRILSEQTLNSLLAALEVFPKKSNSSLTTWSSFHKVLSLKLASSDHNEHILGLEKVFESTDPTFEEFGIVNSWTSAFIVGR